jgi:GntR family transcriptional regulator, transcriptional repressor for pyruvate dehydrogenase complex
MNSDPFEGAELTQVRLGDGIVAHLTQAIIDGRLAAGAPLPSEARLAERYGVSKQVLREAIRQMAAMGVLQVGQGRVTRVRALDAEPLSRFWRFAVGSGPQGLAEAVELRRMIEPASARLAALRHTKEELATLRRVLARLEQVRGDIPAWIEADLEFHDQVVRMAHNRLLLLQMRGMQPVIRVVMDRFNARGARNKSDWHATWKRHAVVVDALATRDPAAAEAAMFAHFAAADVAIAEMFPDGPPLGAHER